MAWSEPCAELQRQHYYRSWSTGSWVLFPSPVLKSSEILPVYSQRKVWKWLQAETIWSSESFTDSVDRSDQLPHNMRSSNATWDSGPACAQSKGRTFITMQYPVMSWKRSEFSAWIRTWCWCGGVLSVLLKREPIKINRYPRLGVTSKLTTKLHRNHHISINLWQII